MSALLKDQYTVREYVRKYSFGKKIFIKYVIIYYVIAYILI